jgi:hypothetical protein
MERVIDIFCDDCSTWDELKLITNVKQKRINDTDEPYIEFNLFSITWRCFIYGMNNTNLLPQKLKNASEEGCRPDIWFYDRKNDTILLGVEQTSTAPVGNALKQRITRPFWALENKVGFIYVSPQIGMDQSQKAKRKQTGPFLQFSKVNPLSFITPNNFNLTNILEEISNNDIEKYQLSHNFNFNKLGKSKISVKKTQINLLIKLFFLINNDDMVYNIIEKTGNIYMVDKNSKTAKLLGFNENTILIIGKCWKSKNASGYSDPLSGGILMMWYINKWLGDNNQIVVISTHDCQKYNTINLINHNNKMTLSLSKVNCLMDACGMTYQVKHDGFDIFKYNGDDESIATYSRARDLRNQGIKLDFIQYPHGSWSSKDGNNTQERDKKRGDIYHNNALNGEEGKTKLSDVYKHIKKYGLIHDYYYYLTEDCVVDPLINNKCIKVVF